MRDRTANVVALIAIAGLVARLRAADRNLLTNLVIDRLAADLFAPIPNNFLHRLVASRAASLGLAQIAAGCAGGSGATVVTGPAAVSRFSDVNSCQQQE